MARKNNQGTEETIQTASEPVIAPVTVENIDAVQAQPATVEIPQGHVLIVAIKNGEEVPGSGFFYPEKSYKKYYGDESKFSVKKKVSK